MSEAELRAVVDAQARARVAGEMAAFASYMAPQAVIALRGNAVEPPLELRPRRFKILETSCDTVRGSSVVQFSGGGAFELHERWEHANGLWRAVEAWCPPETLRLSNWRRLRRALAFWRRREPAPARRDLE